MSSLTPPEGERVGGDIPAALPLCGDASAPSGDMSEQLKLVVA